MLEEESSYRIKTDSDALMSSIRSSSIAPDNDLYELRMAGESFDPILNLSDSEQISYVTEPDVLC